MMRYVRAEPIVRTFRRAAPPLCWYYAITLALPLAHGAARGGAAFAQHALIVLVVPPILLVAASVVREAVRALTHRVPPTPRNPARRHGTCAGAERVA